MSLSKQPINSINSKVELTLRDEIGYAMERLASRDDTIFLGENVINSGRIYGTLNRVAESRCIEMPIAENLIAGTAIGLALAGYHPVCIFQRMDFMLIAADQIINHACFYHKLGIPVPVIFRTIRADLNDKFFVGLQHSKDLAHVFNPYLPVFNVMDAGDPISTYREAYNIKAPTLVIEDYARFNEPLPTHV